MRLILRILVGVYITYLAVVVLVLTPVLNFLPASYVKKEFGRELSTDIILFNPFTMALKVRRASLPEENGEPFVELDDATVDLSVKSLWEQGWVFDEISIHGLFAHVKHLRSGEFNFSDMLPPESPEPEPETDEPVAIPGVTIHQLAFQADEIRATQETAEETLSTALTEIDIEVINLSTVAEEGQPYRIDAAGERGGVFKWRGEVSVPAAYSEGFLSLTGLKLDILWRFAKPWLNFELRDGTIGMEGRYRVDWKDQLTYSVNEGLVSVDDIDIAPMDPGALADTGVSLTSIRIPEIEVDSTRQHASLGLMTIDALQVDGWMEGEQVSLVDLFAIKELPTEETEESDDTQDEAGESRPWTAEIAGAALVNSAIRFRTPFTDPPLLEVNPLEASLGRINWPLAGDTSMDLNLSVNNELTAGIDGALDLGSGQGALEYRIKGLPLVWFNPNFPTALKAQLTNGYLATDGRVTLADFSPTNIENQGEVSDFAGKIQDAEEAITSWDLVRWEDLSVDLVGRVIELKKVYINRYAGRVHIREDGTVNAQRVWQEEVGEQAQEVAEDLSMDEPWAFSLPQVLVADSAIDFMDESLPIKFRTVIGDLNGEVLGIGTSPDAQAQVDLRGSVDGYAPVTLAGNARPMGEPPAMDLKLNFTGVDLALLTPYSANYAGYAIDRGLMNLNLEYVLEDARLQGENNLRIEQLKLGEKIESEDAVDLPLELALALLTDSNGVIQMDVPVSGDVDDPEFSIGSVVAGAFINLITKAVTAPFNLLASLVGSEEDLQRVNFALGSSELNEGAKTGLDQLNQALGERPQLTLVITGRLSPEADHTALQQQALRQQLIKDGLPEQDIDAKSSDWEKAINTRYRANGLPDGDEVTILQQYDAVTKGIEIEDKALEELAEARAVAVKSYLVNEAGLAPDRAVIEQSVASAPENNFSGVELGL